MEKFIYKHYTVTARLLKETDGFAFEKKKDYSDWHYCFSVTVKNTETGIRRSFQFTSSTVDHQNGKNELSVDDLKDALAAIISDGYYYIETKNFEDFCKELGYDKIEDYRRARAAYTGCKKAAEKIEDLDLDPVEDGNALND